MHPLLKGALPLAEGSLNNGRLYHTLLIPFSGSYH
jgi:hypothetical protein